jgi:hypothetical protein
VLAGEIYELQMKSKTGILQSVAVPGFEIRVRAIFEETAQFATSAIRET